MGKVWKWSDLIPLFTASRTVSESEVVTEESVTQENEVLLWWQDGVGELELLDILDDSTTAAYGRALSQNDDMTARTEAETERYSMRVREKLSSQSV